MLSRRISAFTPILKSATKNKITVQLSKRRMNAFLFSTSRPGAQKM